jgi:hypothetical protein
MGQKHREADGAAAGKVLKFATKRPFVDGEEIHRPNCDNSDK